MLGIGDRFFLQIADESERRLFHSAKIIRVRDQIYTAEVEHCSIEKEQDAFISYAHQRQFVQQPIRIVMVTEDESKPSFDFKTTGEPLSSDFPLAVL